MIFLNHLVMEVRTQESIYNKIAVASLTSSIPNKGADNIHNPNNKEMMFLFLVSSRNIASKTWIHRPRFVPCNQSPSSLVNGSSQGAWPSIISYTLRLRVMASEKWEEMFE